MRPQQWVKNAFIFLPLFFGGHLFDAACLLNALVAFAAYCLAASGIYCFNDIYDVEADRRHPKKCRRPVAAGLVSKAQAYVLMAVLVALAFAACLLLPAEHRGGVAGILLFYVLMNVAYCVRLKRYAIVDLFVIATGFVLRVWIGGVATGIWISQWIVLMTFLLALFLAFAKRRDDVVIYAETKVLARRNVNRYNLDFMNQAIGIVASITMVCYILYTVSDDVAGRVPNARYLYMTAVWVLAGIMRYLQLTIVDVRSGSPTRVLLHDHFVQLCIAGWIASFALLLYV